MTKLIRDAGYEVKILSSDENLFQGDTKVELVSHSGFDITIHRAQVENNKITALGQELDLIILNNDQSSPLDIDWTSLETPVAPSPLMGWNRRTKHGHFEATVKLSTTFVASLKLTLIFYKLSFA